MKVNIETKFDIGDKVFILHDNTIASVVIESVHIHRTQENKKTVTRISYQMKWSNKVGSIYAQLEEKVFATKEELVKSLL